MEAIKVLSDKLILIIFVEIEIDRYGTRMFSYLRYVEEVTRICIYSFFLAIMESLFVRIYKFPAQRHAKKVPLSFINGPFIKVKTITHYFF